MAVISETESFYRYALVFTRSISDCSFLRAVSNLTCSSSTFWLTGYSETTPAFNASAFNLFLAAFLNKESRFGSSGLGSSYIGPGKLCLRFFKFLGS